MSLREIAARTVEAQALADALHKGHPRCEDSRGAGAASTCLRRQRGHLLDVNAHALCDPCAAYWHAECAALLLARLAAEAPDDVDVPRASAPAPASTPAPAPSRAREKE